MFKLALVAVCSFGLGVALMDTLHEPAQKPRAVAQQAVLSGAAPGPRLESPIMRPNATVQHCRTIFQCGPERRYYAGMLKK